MSSEGLTGQYARFALVLQEFNFVIEHGPGMKHQNANTLSRHPRDCSIDDSRARCKRLQHHLREVELGIGDAQVSGKLEPPRPRL